jgi:hypothetical protein
MRKLFASAFATLALLASPSWAQTAPVLCNQSVASAPLNAGTAPLVTGVAGKAVYFCGFTYQSTGVVNTLQIVAGTGPTCTSSTPLTGLYLSTTSVSVVGHSNFVQAFGAPGQTLCAVIGGTNTVVIQAYYAQF